MEKRVGLDILDSVCLESRESEGFIKGFFAWLKRNGEDALHKIAREDIDDQLKASQLSKYCLP
jgi:hypothetical protein